MVAPTQFVIRDVQLVSFIIPAWNEESVLPSALAAVTAVARRLAGPGEIIVVDDASTDRTAEIARAGGASVVSVNHGRSPPRAMLARKPREEICSSLSTRTR